MTHVKIRLDNKSIKGDTVERSQDNNNRNRSPLWETEEHSSDSKYRKIRKIARIEQSSVRQEGKKS